MQGNVKYSPEVEEKLAVHEKPQWQSQSTLMLLAMRDKGYQQTFVRPDQSVVDKRRAKNKVARKQRKVNAHH